MAHALALLFSSKRQSPFPTLADNAARTLIGCAKTGFELPELTAEDWQAFISCRAKAVAQFVSAEQRREDDVSFIGTYNLMRISCMTHTKYVTEDDGTLQVVQFKKRRVDGHRTSFYEEVAVGLMPEEVLAEVDIPDALPASFQSFLQHRLDEQVSADFSTCLSALEYLMDQFQIRSSVARVVLAEAWHVFSSRTLII